MAFDQRTMVLLWSRHGAMHMDVHYRPDGPAPWELPGPWVLIAKGMSVHLNGQKSMGRSQWAEVHSQAWQVLKRVSGHAHACDPCNERPEP